MLLDNALKFYRGQAYDIPQKPIENGQYINKIGLLVAIWKFWMETTCLISETVRDRAKRSKFSNPVDLLPMKLQLLKILFWVTSPLKVTCPQKRKLGFTYYEITAFENLDFESNYLSRSHDLGKVN